MSANLWVMIACGDDGASIHCTSHSLRSFWSSVLVHFLGTAVNSEDMSQVGRALHRQCSKELEMDDSRGTGEVDHLAGSSGGRLIGMLNGGWKWE